MTSRSNLETASAAHELHTEIESLVKSSFRHDIRLGQKLHDIKQNSWYKKAVGAGINTWGDYLKQPEVNITAYRAAKLIRLYEHFILEVGYKAQDLDGVPTYALDYIADKGLTDKDGVDSLLDDARFLSAKDFKERYHDDITRTARTYTYLIMRKCVETGNMEKVHEISSDKIQEAFNL